MVINKNQDKDTHRHSRRQKGKIDEREWWRVETERRRRKDRVVRRLVRLTTWTQEQWDPHLDLSVWWNKLPATIPYSTLSTDVTSKASLFPLSSLLSPSKYSFVPLFLFLPPSQPLSAFLSLSLVLSVSDTQWIREYLAARYQTTLHLPLPLCAQAYQSESHCQDRCHWHSLHLLQHSDDTQLTQLTDRR